MLSANIKMKRNSMDQVMDIDKLNEFNLSKKVEEVVQQIKSSNQS